MGELLAGAILGAVLGSIVIPILWSLMKKILNWWQESRPANKLFEGMACQSETCRIFMRDLFVESGSRLISIEPRKGKGFVSNIPELWPDADGRAVASVLNVLGKVGKTEKIEMIRMSQDIVGQWNSHIFVIGGQTQKSYDFYQSMDNVAYKMDGSNIYDAGTGNPVPREENFGYGIILKASNRHKIGGDHGVGFLIGGFESFGTRAATYYFKENFVKLGKEFDKACFGILVRACWETGEQTVERVDFKMF